MASNVVPLTKKSSPLGERSDDELMLLASGGAREAFAELVSRHAGRVVAFASRSVGDRARGEEIAQEVWLSVWDHRARYRAEGTFASWLFTLAKNRVRNAHRDAARQPARVPVVERRDLSPSELDRLLVSERRARVDHALSRLSPQLREAMLLRFGQELPYEGVARALETNESTARSRVFHGLRELRRVLKGEST